MENIDRIREKLGASPLDAVLLTGTPNRLFATGMESSAGVAFITAEKAWFFTDFRYIEHAREVCRGYEVKMCSREMSYPALINEAIEAAGVKKVGYEERTMTCASFEGWKKDIRAELTPMGGFCEELRAVKLPWEIEMITKAQRITEAAFDEILGVVRAGMSERELHAELVYRLLKNGGEGLSFEPIVVSGRNSSLPHGQATSKLIEKGDFVTMDFGVLYKGYCSDMTRTVAVGCADDEMKRVYETVLEAQEASFAHIKEGAAWKDVHNAAAAVINKDYDGCFGHGIGHGVGVEIHEGLDTCEEKRGLLPENGILTVEPGIYIEGRMGVRIEDMVVIKKDGYVNLTRAPKQLLTV